MHSQSLQLVFTLRRSPFLPLVALGTTIAAIHCFPAESRAEFLTPAWRGASDATWYQWTNPFGPETPLGGDPALFFYAPGSSRVPETPPAGSASLVTPLIPISSGNFYNGSFGDGSFVPDTFTLSVPSLLQPGTAGTVVLQVRGALGEFGAFISTPLLTVGAGTVPASLLQQVAVGPAGGGGFSSTVVESLFAWDSVQTEGGPLEITFQNANHVSLMAVSADTSAAVAPVPEPGTTAAAAAAAAAMAAAGYGRRRLLRRGRKQATGASVPAAEQSVEASPSSNSSSSSPSSQSSSASCSQLFIRPAKAPGARGA